ncbi:MAG: DNA repair protein RecO [Elusimicrobiota bacterium]
MIVNAKAVVIARQNWGEADKLLTLYTENLGKIRARCVGVNKPGRKMKALSEPFVWAEFRLHLGRHSDMAKVIGGQILSSFPRLRRELNDILTAFSFCEMLNQITPESSPNPEKYDLLVGALRALDTQPNVWILPAYGLRLLELAGQPALFPEGLDCDGEIESLLRGGNLECLDGIPSGQPMLARRIEYVVAARVRDYSGRDLRCPEAVSQWRRDAEVRAC